MEESFLIPRATTLAPLREISCARSIPPVIYRMLVGQDSVVCRDIRTHGVYPINGIVRAPRYVKFCPTENKEQQCEKTVIYLFLNNLDFNMLSLSR